MRTVALFALAKTLGGSRFLGNSVILLLDALLPCVAFQILLPSIFEDHIQFSFGHRNGAHRVLSTLQHNSSPLLDIPAKTHTSD